MTEIVTSTKNQRVVAASRLTEAAARRDTGLTLIEGPHILQEAFATGQKVMDVFCLADDDRSVGLAQANGVPVTRVTQPVLERIAPTEHPRGPVATMVIPSPRPAHRDLMVLEVDDPGNAGTLIRTAAAFGFDVAVAAGVDPWSPKVIRAGAGAHFRTRFADDYSGWGVIAAVVRGGADPARLPKLLDPARRWAIIIGSEAHGIAPERVAGADLTVTIPMPGMTESLNAAGAGAILAFELARWRMGLSAPPGAS
jgi:TrmH family RNA methyltransferase